MRDETIALHHAYEPDNQNAVAVPIHQTSSYSFDSAQHAADLFARHVVLPAIRQPRGLPRVRALFERWVAWVDHPGIPGGCIFMSAAAAYDDRPGAVRDLLSDKVSLLRHNMARACRIAMDEGHLSEDLDPDQFAYELHGILLVHHIDSRLFDDPRALERSHRAFEALVARSR